MILFSTGVALVVLLLVMASTAILEAWVETRNRPREPMFWCSKHGLIREKHCLELFPEMRMMNGKKFRVCPLCYKESVFDKVKLNG